jgi:hypothetical protein
MFKEMAMIFKIEIVWVFSLPLMFRSQKKKGFPWKNQGQSLSKSPFYFREQSFAFLG